jgi:hypothetical protein
MSSSDIGQTDMYDLAHSLCANRRIQQLKFASYDHIPNTRASVHALACALQDSPRVNTFTLIGVNLSCTHSDLYLPACGRTWSNERILCFIHDVHVQKLLALLMGMHHRLGALSSVMCLSNDTAIAVAQAYFGDSDYAC